MTPDEAKLVIADINRLWPSAPAWPDDVIRSLRDDLAGVTLASAQAAVRSLVGSASAKRGYRPDRADVIRALDEHGERDRRTLGGCAHAEGSHLGVRVHRPVTDEATLRHVLDPAPKHLRGTLEDNLRSWVIEPCSFVCARCGHGLSCGLSKCAADFEAAEAEHREAQGSLV